MASWTTVCYANREEVLSPFLGLFFITCSPAMTGARTGPTPGAISPTSPLAFPSQQGAGPVFVGACSPFG